MVVFINNINHTGHKDTTWLYDIGFERLLGKVDAIVGTGPRAYDLAVRLKLAGFPSEKVRIERDLSQLKPVTKPAGISASSRNCMMPSPSWR